MVKAGKGGPAAGPTDARSMDAGAPEPNDTGRDGVPMIRRSVPVHELMAIVQATAAGRIERTRSAPNFRQLCKLVAGAEATLSADPQRAYTHSIPPVVLIQMPDGRSVLSGTDTIIAANDVDKDRLFVLIVDIANAPKAQEALNREKSRASSAKPEDEDYYYRILYGH